MQHDERKLAIRFFIYLIEGSSIVIEQLKIRSNANTIDVVYSESLKEVILPLPPLPEQEAIAAFLDRETGRIDELVHKKKSLIEKLKEQRTAVISAAVTKGLPPEVAPRFGLAPHTRFTPSGVDWLDDVPEGWEVKRLKQVTALIQTGPFGSQLHSTDYISDGIPVINPQNITETGIKAIATNTIEPSFADLLQRHKLIEGEIIFGRRGEMGRCAVVTSKEQGWICGTGCLKVHLLEEIYSNYLYCYLRTPQVSSYLSLQSVGSTMENQNTTILGELPILSPPLPEQQAIATYLDEQTATINALVTKVEQAIAALQEYRSTLITAAVTGKIDVRHARPMQEKP